MLLDKPRDLLGALGEGTRLLGLDLGSKTVGVAISDPDRRVASPLETLARGRFRELGPRLLEIIDHRGVAGLVLGWPVNMDGSEGPRCQATRQFARNLLELRDIPIVFWDERLSTRAVERMLIDELDTTRKRRAELVDKLAAAYILQGVLDHLGHLEDGV